MKTFKYKVAKRKTEKLIKYGKVIAKDEEDAYRKVEDMFKIPEYLRDTRASPIVIAILYPGEKRYRFV